MANRFNKEEPYNDLDNTLYNRMYSEYLFPPSENSGLLYIKSLIETDSSIKVSQMLGSCKIKPLIIDDPKEVRNQEVEWYIKYCLKSFAVIGHLVDNERTNNEFHNAKVSLCMGIAFGFEKNILMVAHEPFDSPLDYRYILKKHKTAYECGKIVGNWIRDTEIEYLNIQNVESTKVHEQKLNEVIRHIDIGDYIAEQEYENIPKYFIDTVSLCFLQVEIPHYCNYFSPLPSEEFLI